MHELDVRAEWEEFGVERRFDVVKGHDDGVSLLLQAHRWYRAFFTVGDVDEDGRVPFGGEVES